MNLSTKKPLICKWLLKSVSFCSSFLTSVPKELRKCNDDLHCYEDMHELAG